MRTCEGYLKKRQRCLSVSGSDARALLAPATISAKLRVRRTPLDVGPQQVQPRAVLRVANRSERSEPPRDPVSQELEPFLQDLQNDVARLSRAFATLGREANALVEAEMRARLDDPHRAETPAAEPTPEPRAEVEPTPEPAPLSRNARRRMRQRLRQAFRETQADDVAPPAPGPVPAPRPDTNARQTNGQIPSSLRNSRILNDIISTLDTNRQAGRNNSNTANSNLNTAPRTNNQGDRANNNQHRENTARPSIRARNPVHAVFSGLAVMMDPAPVAPPPVPPPAAAAGPAANGTGGRNKKKRRQRR